MIVLFSLDDQCVNELCSTCLESSKNIFIPPYCEGFPWASLRNVFAYLKLPITDVIRFSAVKEKQTSKQKKKKGKEYQEVALGYELYQGIFVLKKTTIHPSNFHS